MESPVKLKHKIGKTITGKTIKKALNCFALNSFAFQ
jgi:hypothetical protein